ncbi:hypothetical protein [Hyunsoonleella pacifica]|uniref:DUF2846 domain-containing protein n=1 Tax=Hyunsoonleella pacifica TaxID=1080224 RepID=A0A4Q9FJR2_9FLAO|nr:hypothetical protein [Hyunsoonleella pacifica]TBN13171.1 hypothetical protein EYD46_16890 [Hyunsoonleella pacifica]GGD28751.1 hypothetical protein GCM10011368_33440 [Hyunsoonleella pacifica]
MKKFQLLLVIIIFSSCALKPISSEYDFVPTNIDEINLSSLGNGKVLIYNGADILHKVDNTARLNVLINNKALGQVRPREYVVLNFKPGSYSFKLQHIDLVNMRSEHTVQVDGSTKVIRIEPTITSNKLTITNELPKKFEKFTYMLKR